MGSSPNVCPYHQRWCTFGRARVRILTADLAHGRSSGMARPRYLRLGMSSLNGRLVHLKNSTVFKTNSISTCLTVPVSSNEQSTANAKTLDSDQVEVVPYWRNRRGSYRMRRERRDRLNVLKALNLPTTAWTQPCEPLSRAANIRHHSSTYPSPNVYTRRQKLQSFVE